MEAVIKLLVIAFAVTSMALAPSLIIYKSVDASNHYCTEYKGKTQTWIDGCKQGWFDHDHCYEYNPGDGKSNDFWNGYYTGWNKGHCK